MAKITWTTERVAIGDLLEWEKNPVQLSEHDAEQIRQSLVKFGLVIPLVANAPLKDGKRELIDGHQRKNVMLYSQIVGDDALVDVRVPSRMLTEKEREELAIRLRRNTGEFDIDALLNWFDAEDLLDYGFEKAELEKFGFEIGERKDAPARMDAAEELLKKWGVQPGDIWQIGKHYLVCGDCTDKALVEKLLDGKKARMVFTDPPWNVAIGGDANPRHRQRPLMPNDGMSEKDYEEFVSRFMANLVETCNGDVYCILGAAEWPTLDRQMRSHGFHWSATIVWVKDTFVLGRSNFHRRYEPIWYGWHKSTKSSFNKDRSLDDVWEIPPLDVWKVPRPKVSEEHPTMKPIELPQKAMAYSSQPGDVIFDPFLGSGTTMVACQNMGRVCKAIEIEPKYVAVALERMQEAFPGIEIKRL